MVLVEQVLLLSRDPRGQPLNATLGRRDMVRWLAIAILSDLAAMGLLRFSEGRISAADQMPTAHTLLSDALNLIQGRAALTVGAAIHRVADHNPRIVRELSDSLVRRGVLMTLRSRWLGIVPLTRYALQSTRVHGECMDTLRAAARNPDLNDLRVLALYLLCDGMGLSARLLDPSERHAAHDNLVRLEAELTGNRAATDPTLQRARLILSLTNPFAPDVNP